MSMRSSLIVVTILAPFLVAEACTDYKAVQSIRQAEDPNAAIEMNIRKLREAQQKLSADPRDKAALAVILTLVKDPNGINRANAISVLGEVGEEHGAIIKDAAVPVLINLVERGDGFDHHVALKAVRSFGPNATEAIPVLKKVLRSPDVQKAWVAAEALGRMKTAARDAVPDLVNVLNQHKRECKDDELNICRFALQALGEIGPAAIGAAPDLTPIINDANPYLRAYAAIALLRIQANSREALSVIGRLLGDQNVEVRRRTMWELRDAGKEAKAAEPFIRAALRDKDEAVRVAASELLDLF